MDSERFRAWEIAFLAAGRGDKPANVERREMLERLIAEATRATWAEAARLVRLYAGDAYRYSTGKEGYHSTMGVLVDEMQARARATAQPTAAGEGDK